MFAEYKRDVSHNYLILREEEKVNTASYQVRMLTGNVIPSILKCRMQGLDGNLLFYYDITSRQSLASFYEQRKFHSKDLHMLFGGFIRVMEEMAEFLMNTDQLLLCPEYIFLDIEKREVKFCCLPDNHHPNDKVDTKHIVFREGKSAVNDYNTVSVFKCCDVHSNLLKSAKRNDFQLGCAAAALT